MHKVKIVVHETYQGSRRCEDVFAAMFMSNVAALTNCSQPSIMEITDRSQDSLRSKKGATYGTSEE